jgi:hypothetical protein
VDEVSLSGSIILAIPEEPDLVANAPVAVPGNPQVGVHYVREGDRFEGSALRFNDQADDWAILDVQSPLIDQVAVDERIEVPLTVIGQGTGEISIITTAGRTTAP